MKGYLVDESTMLSPAEERITAADSINTELTVDDDETAGAERGELS